MSCRDEVNTKHPRVEGEGIAQADVRVGGDLKHLCATRRKLEGYPSIGANDGVHLDLVGSMSRGRTEALKVPSRAADGVQKILGLRFNAPAPCHCGAASLSGVGWREP